MNRDVMEKLVEWKGKKDRKPLIIMGARQVGKTWLMQEFGRTWYKRTAYISFFNNPRAVAIFDGTHDLDRLILSLSIESGVTITKGDTLIIFDEIQNAPKALESLKTFCEVGREYHIVAAGSLLGIAHHKGVSFPVGKVDLMNLYPLSYREFLNAIGEEKLSATLLTGDFSLIDMFADRYLFWLKNYIYIGGMPEVVESFVSDKDYKLVREKQKAITAFYREDFGNHIEGIELERVRLVWDSIPIQLAKENRRFFFGKMKKGARASEYETAIQWLLDYGVVRKINMVSEPRLPLKAYMKMSSFKLFLLDVGLLGALSEIPAKAIIEGDDAFVEFKGVATEQYVLQELKATTDYPIYYYGTESATFEQDFLIQKDVDIIPIEVKSGGNTRSQRLKAYCDKFNPRRAVRFSTLKYVSQGWMENVPLYGVLNL